MRIKKKEYWCAPILLLVLLSAGIWCPSVLYLNDDITIRSILSGAYTGTPDGHVVYMQYPLSGMLAWLYRLVPAISWLEGFFAVSIWICMVLIAGEFDNIFCGIVFSGAFFVPFYIYMHYTIVAAVVAGTGVFLLCRGKQDFVSICMLLVAYMIRAEAGFLSIPFAAAALVWRAVVSGGSFREGLTAISRKLVILIMGLGFISAIQYFCYSSEEWKEYLAYNEGRTQIYDYTNFSSAEKYDMNYEYYGMTKEESQVLDHYYIMLDKNLDSERIQRIAAIITDGLWEGMDAFDIVRDCIRKYYLLIRYEGFPYNLIWVSSYILLAVGFLFRKKWTSLGLLGVLLLGRSSIWLYLIWRGRYPERVLVALYLLELLLLLAIGMQELKSFQAVFLSNRPRAGGACLFLGIGCMAVIGIYQWKEAQKNVLECVQTRQGWRTLKEYCEVSPEITYFLDVHSLATYADPEYSSEQSNMMMIGGWLTKSPLAERRLVSLGGEDAAEVLYYNDNVRLVADVSQDVSWLEEYLQNRFGECELVRTNVIYCDWRAIIEYAVR